MGNEEDCCVVESNSWQVLGLISAPKCLLNQGNIWDWQ